MSGEGLQDHWSSGYEPRHKKLSEVFRPGMTQVGLVSYRD